MAKLIDQLRPDEQTPEQTAFQRDAQTAVQIPIVIAEQVKYQAEALSALAKKHGLATLVNAMPAEVQQPYRDALAQLKVFWESQSSLPFPDMPEQPEPAPEPEPEVSDGV